MQEISRTSSESAHDGQASRPCGSQIDLSKIKMPEIPNKITMTPAETAWQMDFNFEHPESDKYIQILHKNLVHPYKTTGDFPGDISIAPAMKSSQERVHSGDLTVGFQDSWAADQPLGEGLKLRGFSSASV